MQVHKNESNAQKPQSCRCMSYFRSTCEALFIGLILGFIDINLSHNYKFALIGYFVGSTLIGFRHAGHVFPCWPILGISLYVVHVISIACGRRPPYVEENYRLAELCFFVIIPSGLGLMSGSGFYVALSAADPKRRESESKSRFFPKTTREILLAVACIGIEMGCLKQMLFPPTIYSRNYSEAKFRMIKQGITMDQVLSLVGQPLRKRTLSNICQMWEYSDQYNYLSNYERRWIIIERGIVKEVISDYWID